MAFDYVNFSGLSHFYNKLKTKFSDITHTHNYAGSSSAGGAANSASKLATAKSIRTNLSSTSTASFDGTANITPGVTGTLPIANGGTGATNKTNAVSNLGLSDSVLYRDKSTTFPGSIIGSYSYISKIAYDGYKYVIACNSSPYACYSYNTIDWYPCNFIDGVDGFYRMENLVYGNGIFLAFRRKSQLTGCYMTYSTNGIDWYNYDYVPYEGFSESKELYFCGDRFFMSIGYSTSFPGNTHYYSYDGLNWIECTSPTTSGIYDAIYADGKYILTGHYDDKLYYSANFSTWETVTLEDSVKRIIYGNGIYLINLSDTFYYSTDLTNWNICNYDFVGNARDMTFIGNKFFLIITSNDYYKIFYSDDGITFSSDYIYIEDEYPVLHYKNEKYFIVNNNGSSFSEDCITWIDTTKQLLDISENNITSDIKTILEVPSASKIESINKEINKLESDLISKPVNNNILINSNFANPVNQRGIESPVVNSDANASFYTIDRWEMYGTGKLIINDGESITLENTGNLSLYQYIENSELLEGKKVALSAKVNGKIYSNVDTVNQSGGKAVIRVYDDSGVQQCAIYLQYMSNKNAYRVVVGVDNTSVTVEWIKLELGEMASPYVPRTYEKELQLCQRYYQKIYVNDTPSDIQTGYLRFVPQIPCEMRLKQATIDASGVNVTSNAYTQSGFTLSDKDSNTTVKKLYLRYDKSAHGLTFENNIHLDGNVILDAEF